MPEACTEVKENVRRVSMLLDGLNLAKVFSVTERRSTGKSVHVEIQALKTKGNDYPSSRVSFSSSDAVSVNKHMAKV